MGTIRILLALLFDESTAAVLQKRLSSKGGQALVSINKALVTRASAVIPAVPLYISLLYRVMKEKNCMRVVYSRCTGCLTTVFFQGKLRNLIIKGFRAEFLRHHGFGMQGVDYEADVKV